MIHNFEISMNTTWTAKNITSGAMGIKQPFTLLSDLAQDHDKIQKHFTLSLKAFIQNILNGLLTGIQCMFPPGVTIVRP